MNLFAVGWNLAATTRTRLFAEIGNMTEIYPPLDAGTRWQFTGKKSYIVSLSNAEHAVAPRNYRWHDDKNAALYDGAPVDCADQFEAQDAKQLNENWDRLPTDLEGPFSMARVHQNQNGSESLEVLTDPFGLVPTYHCRCGIGWIISNSVELLRRVTGGRELDPLGMSMFVTLGWAGSDRTLNRDIRLVPAGQRWQWRDETEEPRRNSHFSRADLAPQNLRPMCESDVADLADEMTHACRRMAETYGPVRSALTAGRDSRLVAALLLRAGIAAEYYTSGELGSKEIDVATNVAEKLGLRHSLDIRSAEKLIENWDVASWRLVHQHDGMVSLWQISNIIDQPAKVERIGLGLTGHGGGIAKGNYTSPRMLLGNHSAKEVIGELKNRFMKRNRVLVRPDARQITEDYFDRFAEESLAEGFLPGSLPDLFLTFERCTRWQTMQARKNRCVGDPFSPCFMRSFARAGFSFTPEARLGLPVHRRLFEHIRPELMEIPFGQPRWPSEKLTIDVEPTESRRSRDSKTRQSIPAYHRDLRWPLLESKAGLMREVCLDGANEATWEFVDRTRLDELLKNPEKLEESGTSLASLYNVVTACYYRSCS